MIEVVTRQNLAQVLPLIRAYQTFYQVADIDDEKNHVFFGQFGQHNPFGCQFLYKIDEKVVAFATVYFCFSSTIAHKVAVMNDLYVIPESRGQGVGRALINHCLDFALSQGACRLQWTTAMDNHTAQRLYDSLEASKKPWLFYTYTQKT
ncbi:MAG: GNAT family N-acetyltransferase [Moraxellaceae bacterium]|nr:GNAT family N-acetyltransferase [Moraxellaceae bacterium]HQV23463.1 GNAT family N-acetyltransferase [Agitococcus sp.]